MYKFLVSIFRILFKILYRVEIKGQINIDGHYMICANHIHRFDPVFIACFTKRPISFMAKKEAFDYPIVGRLLRSVMLFLWIGKKEIFLL